MEEVECDQEGIMEDGDYEIELRRWPREADAPIAGGVPAFKGVDGGLPPGKALPIARIRIEIPGVLDAETLVGPGDRSVTFRVSLKAGTRTTITARCLDAEGKFLCGAYFAYVLRRNWI